jgi:hypothetical protein
MMGNQEDRNAFAKHRQLVVSASPKRMQLKGHE